MNEFWAGKKVFLTGHTGFKGAWLALSLHRLGADVFGYALAPAAQSLYVAADVGRIMAESTYADLADRATLTRAMSDSRADILIHLAAQPLVRLSYADPVGTYMTNVMGTVHTLDALRNNPTLRAAVIVTSDKCYDNREWNWGYREDEAMGGFDPYSSSKGCAELAVAAFRRSYFASDACQIATARAGNVIGGGDWASDRIVPDLIRALHSGTCPIIRNPSATRPWQHVLDATSGYLRLAECLFATPDGAYAQGWNFGPDSEAERSVDAVVQAVLCRWGSNIECRKGNSDFYEANYLKLDSSKARRLLGWASVWDFDTVISTTVDWYRRYLNDSPIYDFTMGQIDTYFKTE